MTESRVRAMIAVWTIDSLGTDPVSVDRVTYVADYARYTIQCLDDPDKREAIAEVDAAVQRWYKKLCSEDTGPCEKMSANEPRVSDDTTT